MLTQRQRTIYQAIAREPAHGDLGVPLRKLAQLSGLAINTLRKELDAMVRLGWLEINYGQRRRMCYRLCDPIRQHELERFEKLRLQLEHAPYRGEAILKAILDIVVADSRYIDNARPSFLINPLTGLPLEYDRYYPEWKAAIEFNGSQHDHATDQIAHVHSIRARDLFKEALSLKHGVTLLVFRPADLSLTTVIKALSGHLPLRRLSTADPSIPLIEQHAAAYRLRSVPALKAVPAPHHAEDRP